MAAIKYRICHMLSPDHGGGYEYIKSLRGSCDYPSFTRDPRQAQLFSSWNDFISAISLAWTIMGPCDLIYEEVYDMSPRRCPECLNL